MPPGSGLIQKFKMNRLKHKIIKYTVRIFPFIFPSFAELHHFYAAPAPGKNFDVASAPAPTLLYSRPKFFKDIKVNIRSDIFFRLILCYENCSKYA
jgi:hypothetical protein